MLIVSFTKLFSLVVEWNLVCDRLALLSTVQETGSAPATCISIIFKSSSKPVFLQACLLGLSPYCRVSRVSIFKYRQCLSLLFTLYYCRLAESSRSQSRQSARLFSSRSNWDFPTPSPAGSRGGTHAYGRGGGKSQSANPTREKTLWYSKYACTLCSRPKSEHF
jgi:hypothetical protein